MDRFENAARFGAIMGTLAVKKAGIGDYAGTLVGAGLGGGGTALYDYLMGNEDNRLIRALGGAGAGALGGAAYDYATAPEAAKAPEPEKPKSGAIPGISNSALAGGAAGGIGGGVGGYMAGKALAGKVAPNPANLVLRNGVYQAPKGKAGLIKALATVLGAGAGATAGGYGTSAAANALSNPKK